MQLKKYSTYIKEFKYNSLIKIMSIIKIGMLFLFSFYIMSCESFLDLDPPKNKLTSETVFEDTAIVESALANIYYNMRENGIVSGGFFGLTTSMGIYTDELDYYGTSDDFLKLYNHEVTASDIGNISNWWSQSYNLIYAANDIIKGVENSTALSEEEKAAFKGQALFVRGYLHSLLVALYGDIPYINTTNYIENNVVSRTPVNTVYESIIEDLTNAVSLLDDTDTSGERVLPNKSVANALLARIYLYVEDWTKAEETADKLIGTHNLELDINKVFLKASQETLWQFKPGGPSIENTQEGSLLVIESLPTQGYALTNNLVTAFEPDDLRRSNWVGSITDGTISLQFAYKYKETLNSTQESLEYSIIFRLAEQYLIRAEARAQLGDITGAQADLNVIRNRAGLGNTTAATMNDLLDAILQERQVELFTEQGHRWFDLKRMGKASEVLTPIKTNWLDTNILLPIPDAELLINPNLLPQNDGY